MQDDLTSGKHQYSCFTGMHPEYTMLDTAIKSSSVSLLGTSVVYLPPVTMKLGRRAGVPEDIQSNLQ